MLTQMMKSKKVFLIGGGAVLVCIAALVVILFFVRREPLREQIVLTYANPNLGVGADAALELRMLQSFMNENPHIRVEIDQINIDTTGVAIPWMEGLTASAARERLPDVFVVDDLGAAAGSGWLLNLTPMAWSDIDFVDLPSNIQEANLLNWVVYTLPFSQDIQGYFVNRDLFRNLGLVPPSFGVSAEMFMSAIRATTDLTLPLVSLNHTFSFVDWYPGAINPQLGFFAFDGLNFALNSPEMLEAVSQAADIYNGGFTFYGIPMGSVRDYFPVGYDLGAFRYGQMAMFYGGVGLMEHMVNQLTFDWDFIGVPGGRSVVTLELIGISAYTQHPAEAYQLAAWMGHSTEGNLRRLEYAVEMGIIPDAFPVNQNPRVLEALTQIIPASGLAEIYSAMDRALVDGHAVLPGYGQARFSAPTGVAIQGTHHTNAPINPLIRYSIIGDLDFAAHSAVAEYVAREQLEAARDGFRVN